MGQSITARFLAAPLCPILSAARYTLWDEPPLLEQDSDMPGVSGFLTCGIHPVCAILFHKKGNWNLVSQAFVREIKE